MKHLTIYDKITGEIITRIRSTKTDVLKFASLSVANGHALIRERAEKGQRVDLVSKKIINK